MLLRSLYLGDDRTIQPDQGKPNAPLIDWLLSFAVPTKTSPVPILTYTNSAKALYERRRFCSSQDSPEKVRNTQFTLTALQNIFGSGNAAIAIMCFGEYPPETKHIRRSM